MVFTAYLDTPTKTLRLWQAEKLGTLENLKPAALRKAVSNKQRGEHLDERGFASLEHLLTLSSFHHTEGPFAQPADEFGALADMPVSRFT